MKVFILAGGLGSRLGEDTHLRPKPMVEIGGRPILWHIMKHYAHYGHREFVLLLGYKGYVIKEYFANYFLHQSDVTIDLASNTVQAHHSVAEPWRVTLLDTGPHTQTGGRLLRAREYVGDQPFFLTYGDGVSDIDLNALRAEHGRQGKRVTLTAVRPEGRFGILEVAPEGSITQFAEKPRQEHAWVSGGFFVCQPELLDDLRQGDATILEKEPLSRLAREGRLHAYRHSGFWQCMDTPRDKDMLQSLWESGQAPWKIWN